MASTAPGSEQAAISHLIVIWTVSHVSQGEGGSKQLAGKKVY